MHERKCKINTKRHEWLISMVFLHIHAHGSASWQSRTVPALSMLYERGLPHESVKFDGFPSESRFFPDHLLMSSIHQQFLKSFILQLFRHFLHFGSINSWCY